MENLKKEIEKIKKEIPEIKLRNKKVKADKAREISRTRKIIIMLFTYRLGIFKNIRLKRKN